jgi:hypothetical protein
LRAHAAKIDEAVAHHNDTLCELCHAFPATSGRFSSVTVSFMANTRIYKVLFLNQGKVYKIYARSVSQGELFGFLAVEELVFGERSSVVVDPTEERIRSEFAGVKRSYIPLHSVLRVDEVEKQGVSKISAVEGGNVAQFPLPVYAPGSDSSRGK